MAYANGSERVGLTDSVMDMMLKLSDGNPGAVRVLMEMMEQSEAIDPDSIMQGPLSVLSLDTHSIYGERIWMFYKDVCGESILNLLGVMRAVQLGISTDAAMDHAIDNRGAGIDVLGLLGEVQKRLPAFGQNV